MCEGVSVLAEDTVGHRCVTRHERSVITPALLWGVFKKLVVVVVVAAVVVFVVEVVPEVFTRKIVGIIPWSRLLVGFSFENSLLQKHVLLILEEVVIASLIPIMAGVSPFCWCAFWCPAKPCRYIHLTFMFDLVDLLRANTFRQFNFLSSICSYVRFIWAALMLYWQKATK